MPDANPKPRLAVFISGGGTTLMNLHDKIEQGELNAEIVLVVASNQKSFDTVYQKELGHPILFLPRKQFPDPAGYSAAAFDACQNAEIDLVCLAGFLSLLVIPDDYAGRVLNIHPSLLPKFGGKGMHGQHVHKAVIAAHEKESGCTVHQCDNTYDTGPPVLQKKCVVEFEDTPDTLAARVFELECQAYPEAIEQVWAKLNPAG